MRIFLQRHTVDNPPNQSHIHAIDDKIISLIKMMFPALLVTAIIVAAVAFFAAVNAIEGGANPQPARKIAPEADTASPPDFGDLIDVVEYWLD